MDVPTQPQAGPSKLRDVPESIYQPRTVPTDDYRATHAGSSCPLIIDNGSSQLRAGWADESTPRVVADQTIARYRDRKTNRTHLLVGGDTEVDATSRSSAKPVFEGDVVTNFEWMEHALDHAFLNLGLDEESVAHPVVMTERLATPLASRSTMSELLFEGYGVPSVTYGVDSLFAFSRTGLKDGLAVGMGHQSTTLIPVVNGRGVLSSARRLAWGGAQAHELLARLVSLKYPGFPNKIQSYQATFMTRESCYFADNFQEEMRSLSDPKKLSEKTLVMQFPFTAPVNDEKSAEELAKIAEKRKESGKRLQEMQQKARLEKMIESEREIAELRDVKVSKEKLKKADYQKRLENAGYEDEKELDQRIKKIDEYLKRTRKKDVGDLEEPVEEPSFPLIDRPDAELTEEEIKEKRKQKLYKAGYDARMKIKAEKAAEKARQEELERRDEAERLTDPVGWAAKLREEHEATIQRLTERKRKKSALGDRKSAAAQSRMKNIADLAAEGGAGPKKKRKGNDDDNFGARDDDWAVYREIDGADMEDEEEDDLSYLSSIEAKLLDHDPTFNQTSTYESLSTKQNALLTAFLRGGEPFTDDVRQSFQVHLNVERSRVPETWFQPHLAGLDSAGLGEIIGHILRELPVDQPRVQRGIYATGGSTLFPGLKTRLENVLRPTLPYGSSFSVLTPKRGEERLDAWKGMAEWSRTVADWSQVGTTKVEYEEFGGEFIKEGPWGNWGSG